jgi:hypothetical protein
VNDKSDRISCWIKLNASCTREQHPCPARRESTSDTALNHQHVTWIAHAVPLCLELIDCLLQSSLFMFPVSKARVVYNGWKGVRWNLCRIWLLKLHCLFVQEFFDTSIHPLCGSKLCLAASSWYKSVSFHEGFPPFKKL